MLNEFEAYLAGVRKTALAEQTEHSSRSALEALLEAAAAKFNERTPKVQHEPRREQDKGAPDFKVTLTGSIIGYVENKQVGADLDRVLKSDQIKRYRTLSKNLLVTDYLRWIWIRDGEIKEARLCSQAQLEDRRFKLSEEQITQVEALLRGFFQQTPKGVGRAEDLALELATRCRMLRDDLTIELVRQQDEDEAGKLLGLFQVFKQQVFAELALKEFADAFAQTLAYGLFLAKFNAKPADVIDLYNVDRFIPRTFELIRELVDFLDVLDQPRYAGIKWIVEEMLSLINALDLASLKEDLSFSHRRIRRGVRAKSEEEARLFERDPYVYFYEDFLAHYDRETRESRGVYYTPPPVVNFIIRAVDDILVDLFDIQDGLADRKRVTVLDFACGTGTFLLEVFQRVFDRLGRDSGKADPMVREHLLRNVFGFEFLIAPYTIAHLKLSQYLEERKHPLKSGERLQIFLTNTLEPIDVQPNLLVPALSDEAKHAQEVKDKPILVITGNPPYSGLSRNMGEAAKALIDRYKYVDGEHFGERKHWLHDDYVKFIAFAQKKMDEVPEGVVGIITNHSFLDNPTFRGMRQSLMQTFDRIHVLNLHGNSKKKERAPDGGLDENVFDIQQGVAISLFVKKADLPENKKGVWYADLWGERLPKYGFLAGQGADDLSWSRLSPDSPYYFFVPHQTAQRENYNNYWGLPEILPAHVAGIITARNNLTIGFTENGLRSAFADFTDSDLPDSSITQKYGVKSNYQWKLPEVRKAMRGELFDPDKIQAILFQPFDRRLLYNDGRLVFRPRREVMRHMQHKNFALLTTRITKDEASYFCADVVAAHKSASTYDISYLSPLWLYSEDGSDRTENLTPEFREWLDERYGEHYEPEEILGCIYAVLYAPTYRSKYAEFLRIDFPRVPFPEAANDFEALSKLGSDLIQAHLMRTVPQLRLGDFKGQGGREVEAIRYQPPSEDERGKIWINKDQYFDDVPPEVWKFQIGGYAVPGKYLKDRKGRTLTLDEVEAVENIINIAAFTLDQMQTIDAAYRKAFPEESLN